MSEPLVRGNWYFVGVEAKQHRSPKPIKEDVYHFWMPARGFLCKPKLKTHTMNSLGERGIPEQNCKTCTQILRKLKAEQARKIIGKLPCSQARAVKHSRTTIRKCVKASLFHV